MRAVDECWGWAEKQTGPGSGSVPSGPKKRKLTHTKIMVACDRSGSAEARDASTCASAEDYGMAHAE